MGKTVRKIYAKKGHDYPKWFISFGEYTLVSKGYFHVRIVDGGRWRMNITKGSLGKEYYEIFPTQEEIEMFIMLYPESRDRWQAKTFEEIKQYSKER